MRHLPIVPAFAVFVLLGGCGPLQVTKIETEVGHVMDVSFMGAHEERRCSKGCRYIPRPDIWWLHVCSDAHPKDCRDIEITHAPWDWQSQGSPVTLEWKQWNNDWWSATISKPR